MHSGMEVHEAGWSRWSAMGWDRTVEGGWNGMGQGCRKWNGMQGNGMVVQRMGWNCNG